MFELQLGKFADEWKKLTKIARDYMEEKYTDERERLNRLSDKELDEIFEKEYEYIFKEYGSKEFWKFYQERKNNKKPHVYGIAID